MQDKEFIGVLFTGKFHEAGSVDLNFILGRESLAKLFRLAKEAKEAEQQGKPLPPGTASHEKYGRQIKLRIRTSREGNPYCEIDTWQPDASRAKPSSPIQAQPVAMPAVPEVAEENDLPF